MRVAVTGAAGLLGRYVVKRLLERGDDVIAIDRLSRFAMMGVERKQTWPAEWPAVGECLLRVEDDFTSSDVLALLAETAPDAIVHAAAQTSHPRSIEDPATDFEVNAVGTMKLLEFLRTWRSHPPTLAKRGGNAYISKPAAPRLVFVSSAKLYGQNVEVGCYIDPPLEAADSILGTTNGRYAWFVEERRGIRCGVGERCPIGDGTIMTPFGVTKAFGDLMTQQYAKLYGLDAVVLRPGCFTARGSHATTAQNWAPLLCRAALCGEPFEVYGYEGNQVRDLLHADDLARAVLACVDWRAPAKADYVRWKALSAESPLKGHVSPLMERVHWHGDVFNVGGGPDRSVSILEANDLIGKFTGRKAELVFREQRPGDWPWFVTSNRRIGAALGWKPEVRLEALFRELCDEAREAS